MKDPRDAIPGEFKCPRCGTKLDEFKPSKDRFLLKSTREKTVRLKCSCGYYTDVEVKAST